MTSQLTAQLLVHASNPDVVDIKSQTEVTEGSSIDFSCRLTMMVLGSLLLLSAARSDPIGFHPLRPSNSNCSYYCSNNGGCVVDYVGPSRPGKTSGSCFPHSYGGGCGGTPPECSNCNSVLTCHEPGVRNHKVTSPPRRGRSEGDCQYNCEGWPYSQCEVMDICQLGTSSST